MKKVFLLFVLFPVLGLGQSIISDDIHNFWKAYDAIVLEKDSVVQIDLIKRLYINKGTPGLEGIMKARNYSAEEYVYAINSYPKFWNSIRANTLKANQFSKKIQQGVAKLKKLYPDLKPVNTYFEIGVLRTVGTTIDGKLLIGSEIALADTLIVTTEFDERYPHLKTYFATNPIHDVVFLNVHEYLHTQQRETIGNSLLSQTLIEGVAEFLAEIALEIKSPNPQIQFGYQNEAKIKSAFEKEMFSPNIYNWIMNDSNNPFGMRDLGYFVGYAICKKYYDLASNKKVAVKEMIELDYNNEAVLIPFVEKANYFSESLSVYKEQFEKSRPTVLQFKATETNAALPTTKTFTIVFSEEMNPEYRNFELGPLGENNLLRITKVIGFSEDKKAFTFESVVEAGKQYQLLVNYGFTSKNNFPLQPYLIDFTTAP